MFSRNSSDEEIAARIPATMGTQHPDNSKVVPFGDDLIPAGTSRKVPFNLEPLEVHYNFSELGIDEVMIDFEGKVGHPAPLASIVEFDPDFYERNPIGSDVFVTPRVPNPAKSGADPIFEQSLGPFLNSLVVNLHRRGWKGQPIREFVLPQVSGGEMVARIERRLLDHYERYKSEYHEDFPDKDFPFSGDFFVWGVPLIEEVEILSDPRRVWDELVQKRKEYTGKDTYFIRTFDARSDPALQAGMVSAILSISLCVSRGMQYEKEKGIRVLHILGAGSAPFRGGAMPFDADKFLETYPGISTLTLQSAFRYDWPQSVVRDEARDLRCKIRERWLKRRELVRVFGEEEAELLTRVMAAFKNGYARSVSELAQPALEVASRVPSHRDRTKFKGTGGYGRDVMGTRFPRAIKYTSSFTSLGVPPGLLGLGALKDLDEESIKAAERANSMIRYWVGRSLLLLNEDNLARLHKKYKIPGVLEDVEAAKSWAEVLARETSHRNHHALTSEILDRMLSGRDYVRPLLEAAEERRYLG